jgi:hypothetical protein
MTELEAVNLMLAAVGEMPVNEIPATGVADALIAESMLHDTNREVQTLKLNCNTDEAVEMTPDVDGFIFIPTDAISFETTYRSEYYVERAGKLYDKTNHTFVFTQPVYANYTTFLPFEDLPQPVRNYIARLAASRFQTHILGSESLTELQAEGVQSAYRLLVSTELTAVKRNLLNSPSLWKLRR